MDYTPDTWNELVMMAMGAIVPLAIQLVQSFLRALDRKVNSLWRKRRTNSDRPPAEHVKPVTEELHNSWPGKMLPKSTLHSLVVKKQKEEENGH